MAERSNIEWCDATFNGWTGCTKVSPGCDNCYAEAREDKRFHRVQWGAGMPRRRTSDDNWRGPKIWNKRPFWECLICGWRGTTTQFSKTPGTCCATPNLRPARMRVFCSSLADVFDNEAPQAWRDDLFALIEETPNLDWLLLTKRIGNATNMLPWSHCSPAWPNVWIGATIVNQAEADRDVPKLLDTPARLRFVSCEPLLGPINMPGLLYYGTQRSGGVVPLRAKGYPQIDWVIAGGESGPGARPMHPEWLRSLRDQCFDARVPFLFKQWGEWAMAKEHPKVALPVHRFAWANENGHPADHPAKRGFGPFEHETDHHELMARLGKAVAGRTLDGLAHNGFPEVQP